ncbi:MAG TPA: SurA N-terminal domain-containing protein [Gaiellaceae bacterium]|nr:SurA N-terminal domain-containing protein [Gaiellaceae bacterium]
MKLRLLLVVIPLAALVAGCGGGGSAKLRSSDVAVVADRHVTKASFDQLMEQQRKSLASQGQKFPKPGTTEYTNLRTQVVSLLVQNAELEVEAAKLGVRVTDKDVQTQLDQIKKQYFGGSDKRYRQSLVQQGYTDAAVREQIRVQLLSQRLFDKVTADVKASDEDVHAYYVAHKSDYPPTREVQEILVGKGKRALAQSIRTQIAHGADFAKLAKRYSKDPGSKSIGGKFTAKKGQDVPEFDAAVFSKAKTGTLLQPVNTKEYGWFVIKLVGDVKPTSEAQVASTIRAQLEQDDRNKTMTDWVAGVTKSYCKGGKVSYQAGYEPVPDPCAALETATNATTTTG